MKVSAFGSGAIYRFFDSSSALFNPYEVINKTMQESIYVGLDLGSSRCQHTVMNEDGAVWFSSAIATSEQRLRSAFDKLWR